MAHSFAGAFQQTSGIFEPGTEKKPDIHMCREGVHVAERCITDAGSRMTVVQEFADIASHAACNSETGSRDITKTLGLFFEPSVYFRIMPDGRFEAHQTERSFLH